MAIPTTTFRLTPEVLQRIDELGELLSARDARPWSRAAVLSHLVGAAHRDAFGELRGHRGAIALPDPPVALADLVGAP